MICDHLFSNIKELHEGFLSRDLTVTEVVSRYLDYINAVNPRVNAWITVDADIALAQACALDRGEADIDHKPLFGVPVGLKDTTPTADFPTTFGSRAFVGHHTFTDAVWVERLRQAGAVIIGKTSTPEFAAGGHTENGLIGPTHNPYQREITVGGSSGGSAAAVASGMCMIADGSDYGGSLRIPAAFCGVLGLRTSAGMIPAGPSCNLWEEVSVAGPIAKNIDDLERMLAVMSGPDYRTPRSGLIAAPRERGGLRALSATRIAVYSGEGLLPVSTEILEALAMSGELLRDQVREVTEEYVDFDGIGEVISVLRPYQKAMAFGHLIEDGILIDHSGLEDDITRGLKLLGSEVARAQRHRSRIFAKASRLWNYYDFLLMPTVPFGPFPISESTPMSVNGYQCQHYSEWMALTQAVSMMEWPSLSIPVSKCGSQRPGTSIQIVGPSGSDYGLIAIGKALEDITNRL